MRVLYEGLSADTLDGTMCPRWQGPDKTHDHMDRGSGKISQEVNLLLRSAHCSAQGSAERIGINSNFFSKVH